MPRLLSGRKGWLVVFAIAWLEGAILQWTAGSYTSGFGGHPDEAAHYVSALMVSDFLRAPLQNPLSFAQAFADHYPRVAVGNWPPVLHFLLGAWMLIFGVSRISVMAFMGAAVAATAALVFVAARRYAGWLVSLASALTYVAIPLVQTSSNRLMTEHVVTAFLMASALSLAGYLLRPAASRAAGFSVMATLSLLTRGSAWALLFMVPVTFAARRNWKHLRDGRIWFACIAALLFSVPWYLFATRFSRGAMVGFEGAGLFGYFVDSMGFYLGVLWMEVPVLALLAVGGLAVASRRAEPLTLPLLGLFVGVLLIHSLVPASREQRFMVQALPAMTVFAAAAIQALAVWPAAVMPASSSINRRLVGVTFVSAAAIALAGAPRQQIWNSGYEVLAADVLALASGARVQTLIASDPVGEGSFIAAVAQADSRPGHSVVRATKALTKEDWLGRERDGVWRAVDLSSVLDSTPVQMVVVDTAIHADHRRPYHRELAEFLQARPDQWQVVRRYTVYRYGRERAGAVTLYRRTPGAELAQSPQSP